MGDTVETSNSTFKDPQKPDVSRHFDESEIRDHFAATLGTPWKYDIADLPDGETVRINDAGTVITIDRKMVEERKATMNDAFVSAVGKGDLKAVNAFLWYLEDDEQFAELVKSAREATDKKDASGLALDRFSMNLPFQTIVERQIVNERIQREIDESFPFTKFTDKTGAELDFHSNVDVALTQTKNGEFQLVVSSNRGIKGFDTVNHLPPSMFVPDVNSVEYGDNPPSVTIPLNVSADNKRPLVRKVKVIFDRVSSLPRLLEEVENKRIEEARAYQGDEQDYVYREYKKPRRERATTYQNVSTSH